MKSLTKTSLWVRTHHLPANLLAVPFHMVLSQSCNKHLCPPRLPLASCLLPLLFHLLIFRLELICSSFESTTRWYVTGTPFPSLYVLPPPSSFFIPISISYGLDREVLRGLSVYLQCETNEPDVLPPDQRMSKRTPSVMDWNREYVISASLLPFFSSIHLFIIVLYFQEDKNFHFLAM
jgi:hypothetical protein